MRTGFFRRLVDRFGSKRLGAASRRVRQPRLAVTDAVKVDERRHLILVRRDNVEHLLMIGGPADILIEPNVVRGAEREPPVSSAPPGRQPCITGPPYARPLLPPAAELLGRSSGCVKVNK